jgi:uncharacterized membrane protein
MGQQNRQAQASLSSSPTSHTPRFYHLGKLHLWHSPTTVLIIGLHLLVVGFLAIKLNIWYDEAYSLNTASGPPLLAIWRAIYFELQPPFYFLVLSLWRLINGSIWFARLFSIGCIVLSFWFLAKLSKQLAPEIHHNWILLFLAFNPFMIWAAVEIRLYALTILQASLLLYLFILIYPLAPPSEQSQREWSRRTVLLRIAYILVATSALYTQYYLGVLLLSNLVTLMLRKRWASVKQYSLVLILIGIFFVPMLFFVWQQVHYHSGTIDSHPSLLGAFKQTLSLIKQFIIRSNESSSIAASPLIQGFLLIIIASFAGLLLWQWVRKKPARWFNLIQLQEGNQTLRLASLGLISAAVICCTLFFTGVSQKVGLLGLRHMSSIFVPIVLLPFIGATFLDKSIRKFLLMMMFTLYLGLNGNYLLTEYQPLVKSFPDWQQVANYLMQSEAPNQDIVLYRPPAKLMLSFTYQGQNRMVAIPVEEDYQQYLDVRRYVIQNEAQLDQLLLPYRQSAQPFWLLNETYCTYLDLDFNCDLINRYVRQHFTVQKLKQFEGIDIFQLKATAKPS